MRRIDLVALPTGLRLRVEVPETRRERMRGLLGRRALEPGRGLLLERTRSVHTFGMRFALRVAFLDRELRVLEVRDLPPGRIVLPRPRARHVLESTDDLLRTGDRLTPPAGGHLHEPLERERRFRRLFRAVGDGLRASGRPRSPRGYTSSAAPG